MVPKPSPVFDKFTGASIGVAARATREQVARAVSGRTRLVRARSPGRAAPLPDSARHRGPDRSPPDAPSSIGSSPKPGFPVVDADQEVSRAIQTFLISAEEAKRLTGEMVPIEKRAGERASFRLHRPRASRRGLRNHVVQLSAEHGRAQSGARPRRRQHGRDQAAAEHAVQRRVAGRVAGASRPAARPCGPGPGPRPGSRRLAGRAPRHPVFLVHGQHGGWPDAAAVRRAPPRRAGARQHLWQRSCAPTPTSSVRRHDASIRDSAGPVRSARRRNGSSFRTRSSIGLSRCSSRPRGTSRSAIPATPTTAVGPMISEAEARRAEQWIAEAVRDGATVVHGGRRERRAAPAHDPDRHAAGDESHERRNVCAGPVGRSVPVAR